jgi:Glu-tRNA(Gln) amidotransferase subunit E-like FAD-binding protein
VQPSVTGNRVARRRWPTCRRASGGATRRSRGSLTEAEARAAIQAIAKELGTTSKKDMGNVMKAAMARHKGQLDGKLAQKILGEILV